ncbi:MAG: Xylose isomerase-like TIM barrel [Methanocella sp. PtaU1.Bin125]|nr:MAG: Xylose isomerase-like TIM barrel [Methanocella sp. PtaU1.Bin125]
MPDVCLQLRPSAKVKEYARMFDFAERCGFDGVELCQPPFSIDYERLNLLSLEHNLPVRSIIAPSPMSTAGVLMHGKCYAMEHLEPDLMVIEVPRASLLDWPAQLLFRNNVLLFKESYGKEKIAVENSRPTQFQHPVLNIKTLRDFCYTHDVFINFDVSNCAAAGMDILLSCDMLIPRIKNVHFSDYGGQTAAGHLAPGMGLLPLGMLLSRLNEYRYNGLITLEVDNAEPLSVDDDPQILYSEIVGFIKSYFDRSRVTPAATAGIA